MENGTACVNPQKGSRGLIENYRTISVLPAISKIIERIFYEQKYQYLSENSLLTENKYVFRKMHLTVSALLDSTAGMLIWTVKCLSVNLVVLLDLEKAFDTTDHSILLNN